MAQRRPSAARSFPGVVAITGDGDDLRVMRAIPALTRYKRTRQNPRKSSKLADLSWAVLVAVVPRLAIEKA